MGSAVGWVGSICALDWSRRSFAAASQSHSQNDGFNKSDDAGRPRRYSGKDGYNGKDGGRGAPGRFGQASTRMNV
jgi:hypothetical protein